MDAIEANVAQRPVFVLAERHDALDKPWNAERRAQFVHVSEGVLTVRTDSGLWVVPPHHAVWLLPGAIRRSRAVPRRLHGTRKAIPVPAENGVVSVDPLVDELLLAATEFGEDYP